MAPARTPRYELHIRPLMRWIDHTHMNALSPAKRIDLWDYDMVRAKADKIINRLSDGMPPETHGGPWPQEWIDLFIRWKDAGFPRLELATADAFTIERAGNGLISIQAKGSIPQFGFQVWLDSDQRVAIPSEYVLYQEGPAAPAGPADTFDITEFVAEPGATITSLIIRDAAGNHTVPIPPAGLPVA